MFFWGGFCIGTGGCTEFPVLADLRRLLHAIGSGRADVGLRLRMQLCPLRTQARIYSSFLMMQLCKGGFVSVRKEEIRAIRVFEQKGHLWREIQGVTACSASILVPGCRLFSWFSVRANF